MNLNWILSVVYLLRRRSMMTTVCCLPVRSYHSIIYWPSDISIDGDTAVAFTENVEQRFLSYGWQVLHVDNGDS